MTKRHTILSARRTRLAILPAAACALIAAAPSAAAPTTQPQGGAELVQAGFEAAFEALPEIRDVPPPPPAYAVDLDQIEPPVEARDDGRDLGSGVASYYGRKFHGRRTASGERFDMHKLTAAHRTLPFGSRVKVTNPRTGKSVVVRINDRGPFSRNRTIDLSRAAAEQVGLIQRGHGTVELAVLD